MPNSWLMLLVAWQSVNLMTSDQPTELDRDIKLDGGGRGFPCLLIHKTNK